VHHFPGSFSNNGTVVDAGIFKDISENCNYDLKLFEE